MSKKVHELAKELDMTSKNLLEKLRSMGIEVKSHMSVLSDIDVITVKNSVLRSNKNSETKIVKVTPKKVDDNVKDEDKAVAKAAKKSDTSSVAKETSGKETQKRSGQQGSQQKSSAGSQQKPSQKSTSQKSTQKREQPESKRTNQPANQPDKNKQQAASNKKETISKSSSIPSPVFADT
jgi:translation initiation factor IF-2